MKVCSTVMRMVTVGVLIAIAGHVVAQQAYPSKPVHYVVAFSAGDSPDITARLVGDRLSRMWGQQVLVENRVGAGGTIAGAYVASAAPDGYTLIHCNIATNAIAAALYAKLPYDGVRDFAPISRIAMTPNVLQRFGELVLEAAPQSREEFAAFLRAETTRWAQVVKDAGIPRQ